MGEVERDTSRNFSLKLLFWSAEFLENITPNLFIFTPTAAGSTTTSTVPQNLVLTK